MMRLSARHASLAILTAVLGLAGPTQARAQDVFNGYGPSVQGYGSGGCGSCGSCGSCNTGCQTHHCPPHLKYCMEGAPKICVRIGCPKPICNPCTQPGWGYYETCWNPWPWPANYNHCPAIPPAATIALSGPVYNGAGQYQDLQPAPRTVPQVPSTPSMPGNPPPVHTTPMPAPVPPVTNVPANPNNPLEALPSPRSDSLRPLPGNDGF
jgi:hypothetical protein